MADGWLGQTALRALVTRLCADDDAVTAIVSSAIVTELSRVDAAVGNAWTLVRGRVRLQFVLQPFAGIDMRYLTGLA